MAQYTVGQQLPNGASVASDDVQTSSDGTTVETMVDSAGNHTIITTPGAGTPAANQQTIQAALQTAVTYFGGNYTNWATLSTGQKDTAARNAQRALAQIARWLLGQFDSAG